MEKVLETVLLYFNSTVRKQKMSVFSLVKRAIMQCYNINTKKKVISLCSES